jgi:hypothetical protein
LNNLPAFPKTPFIELGTPQNGMTLRDYFAARAMAICPLRDLAEKSEWCYELADYMLEAREA